MTQSSSYSDHGCAQDELRALREAVEQQCCDCRHGEAEGGRFTLRHLIASCNIQECALYPVRPYQGGGR